ncbi:alpha/beta fold hydrolase [Jeotgalibacillus sp. R-1-5s-1]|uniref:alpha/beta fold hydrolase n=1 Tax=Jeotgalibacillus sp. R-1-5s-1 TaxID=2555897 RepID=UPI00106BB3D8|nr:alpha/beta fold hydrolase [Jeotgalibacillus sp. R-1-5s-1]TFD97613.1 alpha/beta fold hydrolase [Jeotgalibacillus sp. R-1-5s-1]
MIEVHNEKVGSIPYLHITKPGEEKRPAVIFIHGFMSAKEHNLHYAYLLAEKGFRVILPDAPYHGERSDGSDEMVMSTRFWQIVIRMIEELKVLKEKLLFDGLTDENRIGVAGTSMGGISTLGALKKYDWIHTGVSLMGSPAYVGFAKAQIQHFEKNGFKLPMSEEEIDEQLQVLEDYDLSLHPDRLLNRPLLFWHGKADTVVPFEPTYAFFKSIYPSYNKNPDHLRFIAEETEGHKVTRKGLLETVKWFDRHMQA